LNSVEREKEIKINQVKLDVSTNDIAKDLKWSPSKVSLYVRAGAFEKNQIKVYDAVLRVGGK
jgi:hypothetical protein